MIEMLTAMTLALFLLVSLVCLVVLIALAGQLSYMAGRQVGRRLFGRRRRARLVQASLEPRELPLEPAFREFPPKWHGVEPTYEIHDEAHVWDADKQATVFDQLKDLEVDSRVTTVWSSPTAERRTA